MGVFMSEVFGVTPWVDGAVSTGPLSAQEQDRLDVAARKVDCCGDGQSLTGE